MAVIRLYSHAPSDTIQRLKTALIEAGHNCKKLRTEGGTYRGRAGHVVFNYGSSNLPESIIGQAAVLNNPLNIGAASNKRQAFERMAAAGVKTVEFTHQQEEAARWFNEGAMVYIRTRLQGHSGEGIELAYNRDVAASESGGMTIRNSVPSAPLYTKGITGGRREYRVHVFKGKIIHIAQKRRRDGFAEIEGSNNLIRNWHTGWVYSTMNMTELNVAGKNEALKAVNAVGLDFGAVDVITRGNKAWVLEVNTAPGMEGVTLDKYVAAIAAVAEGTEIEGETIEGFADYRQPEEELSNASSATRSTPRNAQPAPQPTAQPTAPQQTSRQAAPAPRPAAASVASLNDGDHYWLEVNGETTIGKFNRNVNSFEIIGWEVPIERAETTVVAHIDDPRRS